MKLFNTKIISLLGCLSLKDEQHCIPYDMDLGGQIPAAVGTGIPLGVQEAFYLAQMGKN